MKWSVVMLLGLGLVAALCAAILVAGLSGSGARARTPQQSLDTAPVKVLRASKDMAPMSIVDGLSIEEFDTTRDKVPANALSSPVEVVGKVLSIKMVKGQAFTSSVFAAEGSGTKVTATIPKGKRAIGVAIANYAALDGILYPGASVDVLGSFRAVGTAGSADYREPMSVTLLEGVEVLAIERNTVVSQELGSKDDADSTTSRGGQAARRVTMLVTPQQGKILQLAMEQGTLSLALRNPTDMEAASREGVALSYLINPDESPTRRDFEEALKRMNSKDPFATTSGSAPTATAAMTPARRNQWDTIIMRGPASETVHFAMPEGSKEGN
jgi:pilus assembly protein CpaB